MTSAPSLLAYDPNQVKPGWIAFFLVLALLVATFLLWRSMNTQLGKIRVPPRASFEEDGSDAAEPVDEGSDPGSSADHRTPDRPDDDPPASS